MTETVVCVRREMCEMDGLRPILACWEIDVRTMFWEGV
jgi:hypothetical protein